MMRRSRGFTLVELMIVVLIMAVLLAIAVPQFQAAGQRARATSWRVRNAGRFAAISSVTVRKYFSAWSAPSSLTANSRRRSWIGAGAWPSSPDR